MFGFSLAKILVLAAVVAVVIVAFKAIGRRSPDDARKAGEPTTFDTEFDAESATYVVRDKTNEGRD